ncbi:hypothetical protein KKJ09_07895, partial [Xenorhabdus bovienii]|nr:hypothetical protein [Xenorhabdus bovienii]MDE9502061.1 hypothetical protein [Xenorhabdus bovienii]MDE9570512.1 hypothetical protein [Xenorhabdus bovienii]
PRYSAEYPAGWNLEPEDPAALKWRPSIHMHRWASRITLEVTDIRVERLQDISEEDAIAEGFSSTTGINESGDDYTGLYSSEHFSKFWNSIYQNWDSNPWVWVIEFRRV